MSNKLSFGIIGGGPAGLAAAICLAEKGFSASLFERGNYPIDKVCGEGIMPAGVEFLRKRGVLQSIGSESKYEFQGVKYIYGGNKTITGTFKSANGLGVRRTILSDTLYQKASSFSNVRIHQDSELLDIYKNDSSVGIEVKDGENISKHEFNYLLGCDGMRSRVRKLSDLESNKYDEHQRIGARMHFATRPWSDFVEVYWKDFIEAYITPVAPDTVQFAFLWDNKSVRPQRVYIMEKGLRELFPEIFERVEGCEQVSKLKTIGPVSVASKKVYNDRAVLLGDAYVFLDGITGEGVSIAFRQAECLAELASKSPDNFLRDYEKENNKITKYYLQMTNLALTMSYYPLLRKIVFPFISDKFFSNLLKMNIGKKH